MTHLTHTFNCTIFCNTESATSKFSSIFIKPKTSTLHGSLITMHKMNS